MYPLAQPLSFVGPLANFAPHLLDQALKSIVVLVAVAALTLICPRASAARRHSIWFIATVTLLCLPLFVFLIPGWQGPLWKLSSKSTPGNELALVLEWSPNRASVASPDELPTHTGVDRNADAAFDFSQPDRSTARLHGRWLAI